MVEQSFNVRYFDIYLLFAICLTFLSLFISNHVAPYFLIINMFANLVVNEVICEYDILRDNISASIYKFNNKVVFVPNEKYIKIEIITRTFLSSQLKTLNGNR